MRWLRWLLPSCPNNDGGKLHQVMLDMIIDRIVYECDICHEEFL